MLQESRIPQSRKSNYLLLHCGTREQYFERDRISGQQNDPSEFNKGQSCFSYKKVWWKRQFCRIKWRLIWWVWHDHSRVIWMWKPAYQGYVRNQRYSPAYGVRLLWYAANFQKDKTWLRFNVCFGISWWNRDFFSSKHPNASSLSLEYLEQKKLLVSRFPSYTSAFTSFGMVKHPTCEQNMSERKCL